jgi:hypothetical protein
VGLQAASCPVRSARRPFERRAAITDDYLAAPRELWKSDLASYDGGSGTSRWTALIEVMIRSSLGSVVGERILTALPAWDRDRFHEMALSVYRTL